MATPKERFVEALTVLKELQDSGKVGIYTDDIPNPRHRQLLVKNGFIKEVAKGWYIASNPSEKDGETTAWYSSYWDFVTQFITKKYGDNWCLSADQSLLLHAGNWSVPQQLIVRSPDANNKPTPLPHNTSLFNLKTELPEKEYAEIRSNGLRVYNLQTALIYCTAAVYTHNAIDARTILSMIRDASEVLPVLLENGHTKLAGRLAGAFRNIGRDRIADQIIETFKQADYVIREEDPFEEKIAIKLPARERSPYANRIRLMWMQMREIVVKHFPPAPGIPEDHEAFMKNVDDIYITDAYHSLSIERYRVTPELIEKVSSGKWDIKENEADRQQRDAMAARGYYQAFQSVKETIKAILEGNTAGTAVDKDHSKWYRQLFDPSVVAGLLKPADLAGYRNHQVYIGNSKHVPLGVEAMRDAMPVLFELLEEEPEASVRATLGHFIFVFIHPYMDGNGRMGRFLMNAMLASGGYPWTVIPVEKRDDYMQALEHASVGQNIEPFARFLAFLASEGLKGHTVAELPH
ncbi:Fic family protein [Flavobacterium sp. D11R37]|jgi:fido (protein-threonine AMPylation protein)|uniref:Fic family protein n=1 Tax=Flavobacterium TaxID=237 RepID=UPI001CA6D37B|nr:MULTISPECIES: Fic family protein [Flavobacterium]MBY8963146.1 Fic family protein [Flavobacterium coralii]MCR5863517.1 Fic family protein [Flavobacterium sp. J372]